MEVNGSNLLLAWKLESHAWKMELRAWKMELLPTYIEVGGSFHESKCM